jgi:hypothetical protein
VAWRRRLAGWTWIAVWAVVLASVHAPWSHLGGLVAERLRWLERLTLGSAAILGWLAGACGRDRAGRAGGPSHAAQLRWIWMPQGAVTAAAIVLAEATADPGAGLIVLNGFLAYWAGVDLGFAAWPLARGEPYSFRRPIRPDESPEPDEDLDA